ncbi:hypothetical protein VroAM7_02630 [Vibrio rotiferianus]|uniref:Nitroreductase domain-containing protein n=1 Tax=Vibrio rotiferianus TaxID=190895 RepID=A0A510I5B2_9VIBR|nr:nitroreductase family protein [Vibrio rotiferianus]BBL87610.1 hypothetical protein VroAM7_02630 [Vibrio rotiferianus]
MKSTLKKLLSNENKQKLKDTHRQLDEKLVNVFKKSRIGSSFYYFALSRKFDREHQAVLNGRAAYVDSLNSIDDSSVLLRRNTHRLEKGLIMRPRREVFAKDYILETVECYKKCLNANICSQELDWAHDVLTDYFAAVNTSEPTLAGAHEVFRQCNAREYQRQVPYTRLNLQKSDVSFEQLKALAVQRRSVRWYQDKPVELEKIEQAVEVATLAPSACNRQPFEFHTVIDQDFATNVAKCAMGTAGFADNIPALITVVGDLSAYPQEKDRHVIYIDGALASMQLMMALETLGLSSCPINWPDIEFYEKKLDKRLKLKSHQRPIMMIAVGYADDEGAIPFSQKKSPNKLIKLITSN